jgi:hypothetical protein
VHVAMVEAAYKGDYSVGETFFREEYTLNYAIGGFVLVVSCIYTLLLWLCIVYYCG